MSSRLPSILEVDNDTNRKSQGMFGMHASFYFQKCKNIPIFDRRFEAIFLGILLSPSKAIRHQSPSAATATIRQQLLSPSTAAIVHRQPPSPATITGHRPPPLSLPVGQLPPPPSRVFLTNQQIFSRIQFAYQILLKYHTWKGYSQKQHFWDSYFQQ